MSNGNVLPVRPVSTGERIKIECLPGYVKGSNGTLEPSCTADGHFSDVAACEPKSCGLFTVGENATSQVKDSIINFCFVFAISYMWLCMSELLEIDFVRCL